MASGSVVVAEAEAVVVDKAKLKCRKSRVQPRQGTQSRETETTAKGVLAPGIDFVFRNNDSYLGIFTFTLVYSRFHYCDFSSVTSPLPWKLYFRACISSESLTPTNSNGAFFQLVVSHPQARNCSIKYFFRDGSCISTRFQLTCNFF